MEYLSRITYTVMGAVNYFAAPIAYINKSDIHVLVDGVESSFSWLDSQTVQLPEIPAVGTVVEIYRDTAKKERLVEFRDGSFLPEESMNLDSKQHFMISQEAYDLAMKSLTESRDTIATANEAHAIAEAAREESTEALNITSGMQESVNAAAEAAQEAAETAAEALLTAAESSHAHTNKSSLDLINVDTSGSFALEVNGIEQARADLGNVDMSGYAATSGRNMDVESYRTLLGMPEAEAGIAANAGDIAEVENGITGLAETLAEVQAKSASAIAPQTIVKGAVGELPAGWLDGWCDRPAAHLISGTAGSTALTVQAGLQVAAGVAGKVVLSPELETDTELDITDAINQTDGTFYIYADVGTTGSMSFGYTDIEPQVGLSRSVVKGDNIVPIMTSATTPVGYIVSSNRPLEYAIDTLPYKAFNRTAVDLYDCWYTQQGAGSTLEIELPEETAILMYSMRARNTSDSYNAHITQWNLRGSNTGVDGSWTVLDSQVGISWAVNELKSFVLNTPATYKHYQIEVIAISSPLGVGASLSEFNLFGIVNTGDFYNTANHTHYDKDDNILSRVYIGEFEIEDSALAALINYQHGTCCTLPVNEGNNILAGNNSYQMKSPYRGLCAVELLLYATLRFGSGNTWANPGHVTWNNQGSVNSYNGSTATLYDNIINVVTAASGVYGALLISGSGSVLLPIASAPAKVMVKRNW